MQEVFEKIIEKLDEIKSLTPSLVEYQEADDIENRCSEIIDMVTEYNNGWIPCSERLPEKNQLVLVCAESTTISRGTIRMVGAYANGAWFIQNSVDTLGFPCLEYCVVAWKPLPETYQQKS